MDSGHASYHRHHAQPHLNVLLASEDRSHKYVLAYGGMSNEHELSVLFSDGWCSWLSVLSRLNLSTFCYYRVCVWSLEKS